MNNSSSANHAQFTSRSLPHQTQDAVFFDLQNAHLTAENHNLVFSPAILLQRISSRGQLRKVISVGSLHSDDQVDKLMNELAQLGIEHVDQQPWNLIKNVADGQIYVEVLKCLYTCPEITDFHLVSSDCDFLPLLKACQQYGKRFHLVGSPLVNPYFQNAADSFTSLLDLRLSKRYPWWVSPERLANIRNLDDLDLPHYPPPPFPARRSSI